MELKNIIEKIKSEGVEEAEQKDSKIVKEAEQKASKIVKEAEEKKKDIIEQAKKEADKLKTNGEEALRQASRNVLLSLKEKITDLFNKVTEKKIGEELSPDALSQIIVKAIQDIKKTGEANIEVLLSEKDKDEVEKAVFSALKKEVSEGVTVKVSPRVEKGFLIGEKGTQMYYDVTDAAIAEAFNLFLNPRIEKILKEDNGK